MSQVFIVTRGEYSDYHIQAVFSEDKRELAEMYVKKYGGEIEEWELNPNEQMLRDGYSWYTVYLDRDGNVPTNRAYSLDIQRPEGNTGVHIFIDGDVMASRRDEIIGAIQILATSSEHAIKIANECRVQIIASDNWRAGYRWPEREEA